MIKEKMMGHNRLSCICCSNDVVCLFLCVVDVWLNEYDYVYSYMYNEIFFVSCLGLFTLYQVFGKNSGIP